MMVETEPIDRYKVEAAFSTKRQLWEFLTHEVGYLLPDCDLCSSDWLGMIWRGEKKVTLSDFVTYLCCRSSSQTGFTSQLLNKSRE